MNKEIRKHIGLVGTVCANHYKTMMKEHKNNLEAMQAEDAAMFSFDGAFLNLYKWALENGLPDYGLLEEHKKKMN